MNNLRRRAAGPKFVKTVYDPYSIVVDTYVSEGTSNIEFDNRGLVRTGSIDSVTVFYNVYDYYSDKKLYNKRTGSYATQLTTPYSMKVTDSSVGTFESTSYPITIKIDGVARFYVWARHSPICEINIEDEDGTEVSFNTCLVVGPTETFVGLSQVTSNYFMKVTLTKQGGPGEGNVAISVESLTNN